MAAVAAAALALGGCGGDGGADPASTSSPTATAPATGTAPATTPTEPGEQRTSIAVRVQGDRIEGGGRQPVPAGATVELRVEADVADEVHVHGYDKLAGVTPGQPATIVFRADIPGVFEVELESRGLQIAELVVR